MHCTTCASRSVSDPSAPFGGSVMGPWRHGDGVDFEVGDFGVVMRDGASGGLVVMNSDRK